MASVLVQIVLLDIVFSLDSVLTAVGMAEDVAVMVAAVVIAVGVMLFASGSDLAVRPPAPDGQDARALVPAPDRRHAPRRRVRVPRREGLHLRGDGLRGLRRGAQPRWPAGGARAAPSSCTRRSSRTSRPAPRPEGRAQARRPARRASRGPAWLSAYGPEVAVVVRAAGLHEAEQPRGRRHRVARLGVEGPVVGLQAVEPLRDQLPQQRQPRRAPRGKWASDARPPAARIARIASTGPIPVRGT